MHWLTGNKMQSCEQLTLSESFMISKVGGLVTEPVEQLRHIRRNLPCHSLSWLCPPANSPVVQIRAAILDNTYRRANPQQLCPPITLAKIRSHIHTITKSLVRKIGLLKLAQIVKVYF